MRMQDDDVSSYILAHVKDRPDCSKKLREYPLDTVRKVSANGNNIEYNLGNASDTDAVYLTHLIVGLQKQFAEMGRWFFKTDKGRLMVLNKKNTEYEPCDDEEIFNDYKELTSQCRHFLKAIRMKTHYILPDHLFANSGEVVAFTTTREDNVDRFAFERVEMADATLTQNKDYDEDQNEIIDYDKSRYSKHFLSNFFIYFLLGIPFVLFYLYFLSKRVLANVLRYKILIFSIIGFVLYAFGSDKDNLIGGPMTDYIQMANKVIKYFIDIK
jgi:hypothetical protein